MQQFNFTKDALMSDEWYKLHINKHFNMEKYTSWILFSPSLLLLLFPCEVTMLITCCVWTLTPPPGSALRSTALFCLNLPPWTFSLGSWPSGAAAKEHQCGYKLHQRRTTFQVVELFLFNSLVFPKGRSGNLKGPSQGQKGPYESKE